LAWGYAREFYTITETSHVSGWATAPWRCG